MRRLILAVTVFGLLASGCRPKEKIRVEAAVPENLRSVVNTADPAASDQLLRGFHEVEQGSWRWTASKFSVVLKPPAGSAERGARLTLNCSVAEAVVQKVGELTLTASVNGGTVGTATWKSPGEYQFVADVPKGQLDTGALTFDFSLDKFLPAGTADSRELGLIVASISLDPVR